MTTPKNDGETLQRLAEEEKELERRAAERIKPWGKPQPDDYDFRSWTKGASKELLEAGCFYEYVRESRKLRGLLTLCKLARKRRNFVWSFEGLGEIDARARLGGAFPWLTGLADQLADNESFAELFRASGAELKRSLAKRPFDFPQSNAVKLAEPFFFRLWEVVLAAAVFRVVERVHERTGDFRSKAASPVHPRLRMGKDCN